MKLTAIVEQLQTEKQAIERAITALEALSGNKRRAGRPLRKRLALDMRNLALPPCNPWAC